MRIGVYVCECGINIAATVDVEKVAKAAENLPGVKVSRYYKYMCSDPGQDMIKKDIKKLGLDRIVVASCSPLMHEPTFKAAVEEAGLNKYCFEMANIREQCSWVHKDKEKGTEKALAIVRAAVAKAALLQAMEEKEVPVTKKALVIGAGIAGIQTALDIADMGVPVTLVESYPSIGGKMAQLDKTFPTLDCSACILTPKMVDVSRHPNIELLTYAEVTDVSGFVGNFKATIKKKPRFIDMDKCTGCGDCTKDCPVIVTDEFNLGLGERKAIYIPFPQAVPQKYVIEKIGVSPCVNACPAGVDVQGVLALIREGKFLEALDLVREKNPLPGICGRVCVANCEDECNRDEIDEPLSIRALRRFIVDHEMINGRPEPEDKEEETEEEAEKPIGKKVAIIGSGPAGLTAAYDLARKGYRPIIFEALSKAGGMLRAGIPDYRLPSEALDYDIKLIEEAGVDIYVNAAIGPDLTIDGLFSDGYEAVFVAIGLSDSRKLNIEGEDLEGVIPAVRFLRDVSMGTKLDLEGKTIVVIGGGNVAIDSARSSLRLGAKKVHVVCGESREEMPAFAHEIEDAAEEGIILHPSWMPARIVGADGKCTGVESLECLSVFDSEGFFCPKVRSGTESIVEGDVIIVAIGQAMDPEVLKASKTPLAGKGLIQVDEVTLKTNLPGVFAGGDAVLGPKFAVDAIGQGHEAAVSIDRYLRGEDLKEGRAKEDLPLAPLPEKEVEKKTRFEPAKLPVKDRIGNFNEIEQGLTEEQAVEEAKRCLDCNICSLCKQCVVACEADAINHDMREEFIDRDIGAIVVATGFDMFDPAKTPQYGYGTSARIITGLEFERYTNASGPTGGNIEIDGKKPKKVAFISCVGSRDREGHEYCSRICCMYTAKHAHMVLDKLPGSEAVVYFTDMRAFGKGFEEFYNRVKEEGVEYRRRELEDEITVIPKGDGVIVKAAGHPDFEADLVVLATAVEPRSDTEGMRRLLKVSSSMDGFFLEAHPKLRPIDTHTDGIFLAGCCQAPRDVPDTVAQASGAASRVTSLLSRDILTIDAIVALVNEDHCRGCGFCVEVCPYGAIELVTKDMAGREVLVASVNEALCKGCGSCAAACLSGAMQQRGFTDEQLLDAIDGMVGG